MQLPGYVADCIRALEDAGFAAYAVGGCVRDSLLGIAPHDYDLCSAALPEQICAVFASFPQIHTGIRHGTVGIVTEGGTVEITTFRAEGDYSDNRHPEWVKFVTEIHEDLARRDYTINAIAWSPIRGYADPFGGRQDLQNQILRTVGEPNTRFREDSLRILRGIRFAARFRLQVEDATQAAMVSQAGLVGNLAWERIYAELCGFLPLAGVEELTRFAPVLCQVIPELAPTVGFNQKSPHHAYDVYTHTAHVFSAVPGDLVLRWAALLHDIGKIPTFTQDANGRGHFYGHAQTGAEMADAVLLRLKAPTELRTQVVWLIAQHMYRLTPDRKLLRRALSRHGGEALHRLLLLQEADMASKGTDEHRGSDHFARVREVLQQLEAEEGRLTLKELAVTGSELMALGLQGKAIGQCRNGLLDLVLDEMVPNQREALLEAAKNWIEKEK